MNSRPAEEPHASPPTKQDLIAALFEQTFDLEPAERQSHYRAERVAPEIAAEVEALLASDFEEIFEDERAGQPMPVLLEAHGGSALGPGTRFGDYEIVREIARGGMGRVFEATQLSLGRRVALKVVIGARFATEQDLQRFRLEAEAIARLDHPGIVPVHEVGEQEGEHYFSMAYVGGGSLADLDVPVAPHRAAELTEQIADAMHFAHSRNIVHRDLKPANVLLSDTMSPKVSDFGLAKDLEKGSDDLTHEGSVLGTPGFLSPEQARGDLAAVGPAADVYGLGGVLFYLLTGRAPIRGDNQVETMHRVLHEEAPSVRKLQPSVPTDLASICARCLEKDPARRYGSALALAEDLRRYLDGQPILARPVGALTLLAKWARRRPATAAAMTVAALAVIGGGVVSTWFGILASERAETVARQNSTLRETNDELQRTRNAAIDSRNAAITAREQTEAFSRFLVEDVISTPRDRGVRGGLGRDVTVRDALLAAVPKIEARFRNQPLAEALARHDLGVTLRMAGELDEAEHQLRRAIELRTRELGAADASTIDSMNSLRACVAAAGRREESAQLAERILELDPDGRAMPLGVTRYLLATELIHLREFDRALQLLNDSLEATGDESESWRAVLEAAIGRCSYEMGDFAAALPVLLRTGDELALEDGNLETAGLEARLFAAKSLLGLERHQEAADLAERLLPHCTEVYTATDPTVLLVREVLWNSHSTLGHHDTALGHLEEIVLIERELHGESESYFEWLGPLVQNGWRYERPDLAIQYGPSLLRHWERTAPHTAERHSIQSLTTDAAWKMGDLQLCVNLGMTGYDALVSHCADTAFFHPASLGYSTPLSRCLFRLERYPEALPHQQAVLDSLTRSGKRQSESPSVSERRIHLALSQLRTDQPEAALRNVEDGLRKTELSSESPMYGALLSMSGMAMQELGRYQAARERLNRAQQLIDFHFDEIGTRLTREHLNGMLRAAEESGDEESAKRWRAEIDRRR